MVEHMLDPVRYNKKIRPGADKGEYPHIVDIQSNTWSIWFWMLWICDRSTGDGTVVYKLQIFVLPVVTDTIPTMKHSPPL